MQKSPDSKIQWEDVRYFLALTREGSLSAAARALAVEHSTVGRRVDALEKALALRLFDRLPRGWQLTAEGEQLLAQAERMEEEALAFERAAVGVGCIGGLVRVSVPPSLGSLVVVPRLAALRERWAGVQLEVVGELREANLSRREADIAVRLGRPQAPGLAARPLGPIGVGLYARADYAARPEEEWEFIGYDESMSHIPHQRWLMQYMGKRRFALRSNDQVAIVKAAATGLGVACLPHYSACLEATLRTIPTDTVAPSRDAWLVLHPDVRRSPRVRLIADLIGEIFAEAAAWLASGEGA